MEQVLQLQRRSTFVANMTRILQALELNSTVECLQKEAQVQQPTPSQVAEQIYNDQHTPTDKKMKALEDYFKRALSKMIREEQIDEALALYQQVIPKYFTDLDCFSLLFAEPQIVEMPQKNISSLPELCRQIIHSISLPQHQISRKEITKGEIWFMKAWRGMLLLVDKTAHAFLVKDNEVVRENTLLHSSTLAGMEASSDLFVTSGSDENCKVWNEQLELVFQFVAKGRPAGMCWAENELYVCNRTGSGIRIKGLPSEPSLDDWNIPNVVVRCCTYWAKKKRVVVACLVESEGKVMGFSCKSGKSKDLFSVNGLPHTIEFSIDESMLFVNHSPSSISIFSSSNYNKLHTFQGFSQQHYQMRMSQGIPHHHLLAVTSEDGSVIIYDIKKKQQKSLIKGKGGPVNCVAWQGGDLYFASDDGSLERWSSQPPTEIHQTREALMSMEQKEQSSQMQGEGSQNQFLK